MRCLDSLIMKCADKCRVPAGDALAVDRNLFSRSVTETLLSHPLFTLRREEAHQIPEGPVIISTGPLTSPSMVESIQLLPGLSTLNFYDAAAPIVIKDSLDEKKMFRLSRYGRGNDYLNSPMNEEQYNRFIDALLELCS